MGFRYAALQVAKEFDVAGFVANRADGRVHLEVEGAPEEVAAFVAALEERMRGYVRRVERSAATRTAQFNGFTIEAGTQ